MKTEIRPTPECDAAIDDSPYYQSRFVMVAADFARKLERERDEALALAKNYSERWTAECKSLRGQIEALRKTLIESEAYQTGLVADIEAMREAIKEAYDALVEAADYFRLDGRSVALNLPLTPAALAKLQPFINP